MFREHPYPLWDDSKTRLCRIFTSFTDKPTNMHTNGKSSARAFHWYGCSWVYLENKRKHDMVSFYLHPKVDIGDPKTGIMFRKWLFTRCPIWNVLGWFPCVQVISHLKCVRLVSERSSLPCINIGERIELTLFLSVFISLRAVVSVMATEK